MSVEWTTDLLDDGSPIDIGADVRFLSPDEGGKNCPVRGKYRPDHNFGAPDNRVFYIGQIEFTPGDEVAPGESRRVAIRFLSGTGLRELLVPGRRWRIYRRARNWWPSLRSWRYQVGPDNSFQPTPLRGIS